MTLAGDGSVTQITSPMRQLEPGKRVAILSADAAAKACAALYADDVRQATPTLGYSFPALGARPSSRSSRATPATRSAATGRRPPSRSRRSTARPRGDVQGAAARRHRHRRASADGGTAPYSFKWSSSTTALDEQRGAEDRLQARPARGQADRRGPDPEVTDANGISSTATGRVRRRRHISGESTPGGGGFGKLAIGPTDVGAEQTVDEWQCAHDSANGFRNRMASSGIPTAFDYHGMSAWEEDFKKASAGGNDSTYADNVDAMWYTGHGSPSGFTFKNTTHDDNRSTPSDADWGNGDLEWLNLESCQVLQGHQRQHGPAHPLGRRINGLHMMNGFHTNAYCIDGGTGRAFADYMLRSWSPAGAARP